MTDAKLKFLAATLLFAAWISLVVAKHFWHDLDTNGVITAITSALAGLGVYHLGKGNTP